MEAGGLKTLDHVKVNSFGRPGPGCRLETVFAGFPTCREALGILWSTRPLLQVKAGVLTCSRGLGGPREIWGLLASKVGIGKFPLEIFREISNEISQKFLQLLHKKLQSNFFGGDWRISLAVGKGGCVGQLIAKKLADFLMKIGHFLKIF